METENVRSNNNQIAGEVDGLMKQMTLSNNDSCINRDTIAVFHFLQSETLPLGACSKTLPQVSAKQETSSETLGIYSVLENSVSETELGVMSSTPALAGYEQNISDKTTNAMDSHTITENIRDTSGRNIAIEILEPPPYLDERTVVYVIDENTGLLVPSGRGTFGQVFIAYFYNDINRKLPIAVKEFFGKSTDHRTILNEASILYYLEDTGFVPCCYGMIFVEVACEGNDICDLAIVQDFIGEGVSLENIIQRRIKLSRKHWLRIASQMIAGLSRIHFKGVIVNDIKVDNILLEFCDSEVRIYFIDFGSATYNKGISYSTVIKNLENYRHFAPEVKQGATTSQCTDIYSLGWAFHQMARVSEVEEFFVVADMLTQENPKDRIPLSCAMGIISGQ